MLMPTKRPATVRVRILTVAGIRAWPETMLRTPTATREPSMAPAGTLSLSSRVPPARATARVIKNQRYSFMGTRSVKISMVLLNTIFSKK